MIQLRPYQNEQVAAVLAAAARGLRRVLVASPTGTGKSIVFAELCRRRGGRSLILAHRDELVAQAVGKLAEDAPELQAGIVKAERDDVSAAVVVASVQTLVRPARMARLLAAGALRTVVVDEAHHATADSYRGILEAAGAFAPEGPLVLGVTATAFRADGESLGDIFEEVVYEAGILPMIEAGYLADVKAKSIKLVGADFGFHVRAGDYATDEVEDELMRANAPEHTAAAYLEHALGRRALVFTPTVAVANAMAEAFRGRGVACEALSGETPTEERRAILRRLKDGETSAVANCAVLTEGFDEPAVSCVIVARPTRSKGLYCQMVGRGTRPFPGKADLLILDMVGATSKHDLMTAAKLFDVPERRLDRGESVVGALVAERAAEAAAAQGRRVAVDVDPFRRARVTWAPGARGSWALSAGKAGTLLLAPGAADRWDVLLSARDRSLTRLMGGLSLPYAQGAAEDFARRQGAEALVAKDAPWRTGSARSKQRDLLVRWGKWRDGMTKGEASDLISARVAYGVGRGLVRGAA